MDKSRNKRTNAVRLVKRTRYRKCDIAGCPNLTLNIVTARATDPLHCAVHICEHCMAEIASLAAVPMPVEEPAAETAAEAEEPAAEPVKRRRKADKE